MGLLRRILGALVGNSTPKAEDIVFEPIEGPGTPQAAQNESVLFASRGGNHRVALGDLMARVPSSWKRAVEFVPEQMIDLPSVARMNAGAERPLAFSLRYLVGQYPVFFRDPGSSAVDIGVDLAMEPLREPDPILEDLPVEIVQEAQDEAETFAEWTEETQSERARLKEAKETWKVLKSVQMPSVDGGNSSPFEELLEGAPKASVVERATSDQAPAFASVPAPPNGRLRKILEAYAQGVTSTENAGEKSVELLRQKTPGELTIEIKPKERVSPSDREVAFSRPVLTTFLNKPDGNELHSVPSAIAPVAVSEAPQLQQTRFDELGLSLSRFSEVRGFALWLGEHAMQTGDLGLDTQAAMTRFRMEKILETASLTHGAQDGFLSITVHHARGGISIFGGGSCLVAVSHNAEGMPPHLRSWLCGWVSQPLRS